MVSFHEYLEMNSIYIYIKFIGVQSKFFGWYIHFFCPWRASNEEYFDVVSLQRENRSSVVFSVPVFFFKEETANLKQEAVRKSISYDASSQTQVNSTCHIWGNQIRHAKTPILNLNLIIRVSIRRGKRIESDLSAASARVTPVIKYNLASFSFRN